MSRILSEFYYLDESKPFYLQKSEIEARQIKSMKAFDRKYRLLAKKREQNKLKSQLSSEML